MKTKLTTIEMGAVAFMAYSMYFGAGNLIFPLRLGYAVGSEMGPALIGFLVTAVGFPILVVLACARIGGGLDRLTENLPKLLAVPFTFLLYIILGPLVATPRTAVVAYDSSAPLIGGASTLSQAIFLAVFFAITLAMSINPHKLLDIVGKMVTPLLLLVLGVIVIGAILLPQGPVAPPNETFAAAATSDFFARGVDEGYQTMNPLGSLVLAVVILKVVADCGLTDRSVIASSTLKAMLIAAVGLSLTYAGLAYLGATAHVVAPDASRGPDIVVPYAMAMFGRLGVVCLAVVVILACLTTAVGIMSACGFYFAKVFPSLGYKGAVVVCCILGMLVANIGLGPLLVMSRPVLFFIYPIAMGIVFLNLAINWIKNPRLAFSVAVVILAPFALIDGLRIAGVELPSALLNALQSLPFFDLGLYWVIPTIIGFVAGAFLAPRAQHAE